MTFADEGDESAHLATNNEKGMRKIKEKSLLSRSN